MKTNQNLSLKNLRKNKIYQLLIKYKLIKNKNLSIFYHQTRDDKHHKSFIDKAPENIVSNEKSKLNDFIVERDKIIDNIAMLK